MQLKQNLMQTSRIINFEFVFVVDQLQFPAGVCSTDPLLTELLLFSHYRSNITQIVAGAVVTMAGAICKKADISASYQEVAVCILFPFTFCS